MTLETYENYINKLQTKIDEAYETGRLREEQHFKRSGKMLTLGVPGSNRAKPYEDELDRLLDSVVAGKIEITE